MNATKAAIEEGVVVGGGFCLLRLSLKIDEVKKQLDNEEQKIGAEIFRHALAYPIRKIAENAGVNGSVVVQKVLSNDDVKYGYNAARDCYEDLMEGGIMDPTKVVRCCLEHAASVAKTFPISDAVAVDISEKQPLPRRPMSGSMPMPMPMPVSGVGPLGGF